VSESLWKLRQQLEAAKDYDLLGDIALFEASAEAARLGEPPKTPHSVLTAPTVFESPVSPASGRNAPPTPLTSQSILEDDNLDFDPDTIETPFAPNAEDAARLQFIDMQLAQLKGGEQTEPLSSERPTTSRTLNSYRSTVSTGTRDYLLEMRLQRERQQREMMLDQIDHALVTLHVNRVRVCVSACSCVCSSL